jgi:hypothetical protein
MWAVDCIFNNRIMHFWIFTGRVVSAKCLSCFHGDGETAMVLDLACDTRMVASLVKRKTTLTVLGQEEGD